MSTLRISDIMTVVVYKILYLIITEFSEHL